MPDSTTPADHANVLAPAPVFYGVSFLLGLVIHYFFTIPIMPNAYALVIGNLLVVLSIPIVLFAASEIRKAGTTFDARKTTTALVTSGVFRFSRNPTYLSMTILLAGCALALNSIVALLSVAIAVVLVQFYVVRREEIYLAGKFGDDYLQYKRQVRQWI